MPQILDFKELCALVHLSRPRIYQLLSDRQFPKPTKLSAGRGGRVVWRLDDVERWLEARAAANADLQFPALAPKAAKSQA